MRAAPTEDLEGEHPVLTGQSSRTNGPVAGFPEHSICPRIISTCERRSQKKRKRSMKRTIAVVMLTLPLLSAAAIAQERSGDAALGALSGAVVLGPIGAVAGAVVGYTAGPSIARSWGLRRSTVEPRQRSPRQSRQAQTSTSEKHLAPSNRATSENAVSTPPMTPLTARTNATMPPAQGFE